MVSTSCGSRIHRLNGQRQTIEQFHSTKQLFQMYTGAIIQFFIKTTIISIYIQRKKSIKRLSMHTRTRTNASASVGRMRLATNRR